jgi:hypothetical protein
VPTLTPATSAMRLVVKPAAPWLCSTRSTAVTMAWTVSAARCCCGCLRGTGADVLRERRRVLRTAIGVMVQYGRR